MGNVQSLVAPVLARKGQGSSSRRWFLFYPLTLCVSVRQRSLPGELLFTIVLLLLALVGHRMKVRL